MLPPFFDNTPQILLARSPLISTPLSRTRFHRTPHVASQTSSAGALGPDFLTRLQSQCPLDKAVFQQLETTDRRAGSQCSSEAGSVRGTTSACTYTRVQVSPRDSRKVRMGTGQRFHLPNSLRRGKSNTQRQEWHSDAREYKVQHILGITETALSTARNQSISSSTTARLPALSFSDATTELSSSISPPEISETAPDLQLKASSVLLHEEFHLGADVASSTRSRLIKPYGSSSTLNSHYDAQKAPLAISQQTSDSSRRDFALRKGSPVVVKSTTSDKDSLRQLRLFRLSKSRDKPETKEAKQFAKTGLQSPISLARMGLGSQQSLTSSDGQASFFPAGVSHHPLPGPPSNTQKGVHFNPNPRVESVSPKKSKSSRVKAARLEAPQVKVNIRRPKVGAKYWFDGLEGDSSEDESIHEPQFQPSFVDGMEMAFQRNRIGPMSDEENRASAFLAVGSSRGTETLSSQRSKGSSRHTLPDSAIPPRVSTLNAKSSKSTLSHREPAHASSKPKVNPLASTDLHQTSILDLSSSSEDDEPPSHGRESVDSCLPPLRDSIAIDALIESEIEIGTAKAINTKKTAPVQAAPSLRRGYSAHSKRDARSSMKPHHKRLDYRFTYLSDQSSDVIPEEHDLLTSFPATPTEQSSLSHTSCRDTCLSDNASIESRRLMSVTRQEESLLAAMRLKKATLSHASSSSADRRVSTLREMDRKSTRQSRQTPRSSIALEFSLLPHARQPESRHPMFSDANFDQASCTTFQTGLSNDPSARFSLSSFRTGTSVEPETDVSSSLATVSPTLLSPPKGLNRQSRSTFFSTSTNDSRDNSRSRRESHYLATLEKLQTVPTREEVSSQDFIDWPYHGWDATAKFAAAH